MTKAWIGFVEVRQSPVTSMDEHAVPFKVYTTSEEQKAEAIASKDEPLGFSSKRLALVPSPPKSSAHLSSSLPRITISNTCIRILAAIAALAEQASAALLDCFLSRKSILRMGKTPEK